MSELENTDQLSELEVVLIINQCVISNDNCGHMKPVKTEPWVNWKPS
jgi:hypothetical protein